MGVLLPVTDLFVSLYVTLQSFNSHDTSPIPDLPLSPNKICPTSSFRTDTSTIFFTEFRSLLHRCVGTHIPYNGIFKHDYDLTYKTRLRSKVSQTTTPPPPTPYLELEGISWVGGSVGPFSTLSSEDPSLSLSPPYWRTEPVPKGIVREDTEGYTGPPKDDGVPVQPDKCQGRRTHWEGLHDYSCSDEMRKDRERGGRGSTALKIDEETLPQSLTSSREGDEDRFCDQFRTL